MPIPSTVPAKIRAIILTSLIGAAAPLGAPAAQGTAAACSTGGWTAPRPLTTADGRPVYVEAPFPVAFRGGIALFGTPTWVWRSPTVFADTAPLPPGTGIAFDTLAGIVAVPGGDVRLIGMPPHTRRMLAPRPVAAPDGALDLFWGASADTSVESMFRVTDVWHARYGAAGWSEPEQILAWPEIEWNRTDPDVGFSGGEPAFAVPVSRHLRNGDSVGVLVVTHDGGGWRQALVSIGSTLPKGAALIDAADSGLVVAFTGSMFNAKPNPIANGLFAARSADGGRTWSPPQLVQDAGLAYLADIRALHTPDGRVQLLWIEDSTRAPSGGGAGVARAVSRDGGRSWRRVPGLAFDAPGDALSAAAVGNRIVAVARRQSDRALFTGMFDDGGAPHWTRLPVEPSVSIPRMGRSAFGAPLLVWGVLKSGSYPAFPAFSVPLLLASGFALECAPGP